MAENPALLSDIQLRLRHAEVRPVYTVASVRRRLADQGSMEDLAVVSGEGNLAQAIMIRLLTPRGELAALGHPEYGSRLHELIGQRNTETIRNLVVLYILESVQQEPRVEQIERVEVEPDQEVRTRVNVLLDVKPIASASSVTIGPFSLQLEQ